MDRAAVEPTVSDGGAWTFALDRGGTFTDLIGVSPTGRVLVRKLPSAGDGLDRVADALRELVAEEPAPIATVRCGTTVATNALLTRSGEPCALLVTSGFGDVLRLDDQTRPELFAADIRPRRPLTERVIEVDERVAADGTVLRPLETAEIDRIGRELLADGIAAVAVSFVHGSLHADHEQRAVARLRELGLPYVVAASEVTTEPRYLPRCRTAVADVYLTPLLRRALRRFSEALPGTAVRFLESHGGLVDVAHVSGPRSVLSGPAGGVVATAAVARELGWPAVIGFDMGGTSTDVCRVAGELGHTRETVAGDVRLHVPALRIETVAAGGGSVVRERAGRLEVGPASAGAQPGPAGYGRGGPATLTDAAAVLGLIRPDAYPSVFGARGDEPFDPTRSHEALARVGEAVGRTAEQVALDARRLAVRTMADAIERISVARGHDVRRHGLVCFGGAGPQLACALADALDVRSVVVPRHAGVFSAAGIAAAPEARVAEVALLREWDDEAAQLARASLAERLRPGEGERALCTVELRVRGTDEPIDVALGAATETRDRFHAAHLARYGFAPDGALECVRARIRIESAGRPQVPPPRAENASTHRGTVAEILVESGRDADGPRCTTLRVEVLAPSSLRVRRSGPLLVVDDVTSLYVEAGWSVERLDGGHLRLTREGRPPPLALSTEPDAASVALVAGAFRALTERMGSVLERTAHSTNVKERRDFSCALFDADGRLVVNAPHVPVHLGAMGASVRAIAAARGRDLVEGDVILSNDPYLGGSHLPDVTAVTPVGVADGRPSFWVASRAHHADIGGRTPGSMPALSATIDEEGVRLHDLLAVRDGRFHADRLQTALAPCRGLRERLADLRAQATANATGARAVRELCAELGDDVVTAHAAHVIEDGRRATARVLREVGASEFAADDQLDDGTPLRVGLSVHDGRLRVDFTGTGRAPGTNLHAPPAVVRAAVLYVLRCTASSDVPLNEGCLADVEIVLPPRSLVAPEPPAAVVGGNVETSMRLVDLLFHALGTLAGSQGTMNNVTFGDDDGAYYETLGGGAGASPRQDGASGVHSHMTNTRITDVEVLERRWPVRVRRFGLRPGSGGDGRRRGGDGLVREYEFLTDLEAAVLSGRRDRGGRGLLGGGDGAPGRNVLLRGGDATELPARVELQVLRGDVLRIETPGGGGFGPSPAARRR